MSKYPKYTRETYPHQLKYVYVSGIIRLDPLNKADIEFCKPDDFVQKHISAHHRSKVNTYFTANRRVNVKLTGIKDIPYEAETFTFAFKKSEKDFKEAEVLEAIDSQIDHLSDDQIKDFETREMRAKDAKERATHKRKIQYLEALKKQAKLITKKLNDSSKIEFPPHTPSAKQSTQSADILTALAQLLAPQTQSPQTQAEKPQAQAKNNDALDKILAQIEKLTDALINAETDSKIAALEKQASRLDDLMKQLSA